MLMQTADGQALRMGATVLSVKNEPPAAGRGTPVSFKASVAEVSLGDKGAASGMNISGTIDNIIDAAGNVDASKATVTSSGDLPRIPSALIDAFATKDGTVVDALGPVAAVKFNVERYPLNGQPAPGAPPPVIDLTASSDRANASVKGTIRDGLFVSQTPFKANVVEVTQKLSERFIKGLPLFGTFEKTKQDAPAMIVIDNITAPLGNDPAKLNADINFDPGEARFGTSTGFSEVLKFVNGRTEGQVGKKLEPVKMTVRSGVVTYERWKVPLGEFMVETEGTVNLVTRMVDVITYVPIGAVSDRAMSALKLGAGAGGALSGLLGGTAADALTTVPFRTKGSMDHPSTSVDAELMAKNAVKNINPEELIKKGLGDLLKQNLPKVPTLPK